MKYFIAISLLAGLTFQGQFSFGSETKAKTADIKTKSKEKASSEIKIQVIDKSGEGGQDIVEVAIDNKFSTLVAAVKAADLVDDLQGPGPYTVFAPTNAAFEKLPKETVPNLLKPENKKSLVSILEHHTAAPRFMPEILG